MLFNMKASYKNTLVRVTRYKNTTPALEAYLLNFNVSFLNAAFFIHKGFTSLSQPSQSRSLFSHPSPLRISLPPSPSRLSLSSRVYSSSRPESCWRFRIPWIRGGSVVPSVSSLSQSRPKNKVPKPPEDKRNNPSYRLRKPTRGQLKTMSVRVRRARLFTCASRELTGSVQHADASLGICAKLCIHLGGFGRGHEYRDSDL